MMQMTMNPIEPLEVGICSWSLQVKSIPELKGFMDRLGVRVVQIACGDPHHASWDEGNAMPAAAKAAGLVMSGAMLGFPGEDYTTPETIERTGGFGNPATRVERLETLKWGLHRTRELGLTSLTFHAGFVPEVGHPGRAEMLQTLACVGQMASDAGVTAAFETGQETAANLKRTLDELACAAIGINFDPANVMLYDHPDPIGALEQLAPHLHSVHVKDALPPKASGEWGQEVPLGTGATNTAQFVTALKRLGFTGPLVIEREVGTQAERFADIAAGVKLLRELRAGD